MKIIVNINIILNKNNANQYYIDIFNDVCVCSQEESPWYTVKIIHNINTILNTNNIH